MLGGAMTVIVAVTLGGAPLARAEDVNDKIQRMERELEELKREVQQQKQQKAEERPVAEPASKPAVTGAYRELLDRIKIGAYGSMRFEASDLADQKNSFVFRRFVLTTDANIAPRLRGYMELEFERFRKLELERTAQATPGGLLHEQAIEATNDSEISLEQAWLQYDIENWLKFRAGGILVPLGRFNINHDDNRWDLPRRSLVDRGVPVLPSTAAWDEVGMGFLGEVPLTENALLNYEVYAMNGVSLDSEFEQKIEPPETPGGAETVVSEVKLSPSTGGFASDVKDSKAVAGRVALSPALGHEIGGSWYFGQYTPDFLGHEDLWAAAVDGRSAFGPFEVEGEWVFTRFEGTGSVARNLAQVARDQSIRAVGSNVETEVEFELAELARNKHGYWVEGRYRFWPAFLKDTFLARSFASPQLVVVVRPEQAWLDGLIEDTQFENGTLTNVERANRRVDRFSVGLAYRPVPLVVFQLAYEYTQTNHGRSLAGVTNFLPARPGEDHVNTVMLGTAFGF